MRLYWQIVACALAAVAAWGCEDAMQHDMNSTHGPTGDAVLMAGAAETIVTPALAGTYVYSNLYARALVIDDGRQPVLIMSVDSGGMSEHEMVAVLQRAIHTATGIRPERIMINTSHTHNCPWPGSDNLSGKENVWLPDQQISTAEGDILFDEWFDQAGHDFAAERGPFVKWYMGHLVEVAKRASENTRPAELRVGRAPVHIAYNRRVKRADGSVRMGINPDGDMVPWVDVLDVVGADDGGRIATLFAYAAHPVIVHFANSPNNPDGSPSYIAHDVGADFPGYAVENLRRLLGDEGVFMYAQGCGADINGYPLKGGYGAADAAGLALAFGVKQALATAEPLAYAPINDASLVLTGDPLPDNISPYPLRAFAVGDQLAIMCTPRETFSGYQLFAESASPFARTIVLGYTNGTGGYVQTETDYEAHIKQAISRLLEEVKAD